jgi:hypothetical protein
MADFKGDPRSELAGLKKATRRHKVVGGSHREPASGKVFPSGRVLFNREGTDLAVAFVESSSSKPVTWSLSASTISRSTWRST